MNFDGKKTIAKPNANTYDIIEALIKITPTAIKQVKPKINDIINVTGDAYKDALQIAAYIRKNVTYKQDGYENHNIQLPARMFLDTKKADCKSFSLAFVSLMKASGHKKVGYRFASYRNNKIPTHVYNWILYKNKLFTFDTCVKNLKESKRHTYIKDMNVNYLSEPDFIGSNIDDVRAIIKAGEERGLTKAQIKVEVDRIVKLQDDANYYNSRPNFFEKVVDGVKMVAMAIPRNSFRLLVSMNVRGLAKNLHESVQKNPGKVKGFWERIGGKFDGGDSLMQSINTGKNKKALFGEGRGINGNEEYLGEPLTATVTAAIATATPILLTVKNLFKDLGIEPEDIARIVTPKEKSDAEASGKVFTDANFKASDPEYGVKPTKDKTGALTTGFTVSPLLIGGVVGAGFLIYMLTKKKK
jgi:hypothetical protein